MLKHAILGMVGALALFGCGGGSGGGSSTSTKPRVAYINASPDAGSLDFLLDTTTKGTAVPYGSATDFGRVDVKDYDVSVLPIDGGETIWSEAHTFATDTDTFVVAVGLRTPFSDTTQTPPVVENDKRLVLAFSGALDRTTPVGNRARLYIVHAFVRAQGFGTPPVDFRSPGNTPQIDIANIAFGGITSANVDSGSQTFLVRQNGTEQDFIGATTFNLEAGKIYVALISGVEGGTGSAAPAIRLLPVTTRDP